MIFQEDSQESVPPGTLTTGIAYGEGSKAQAAKERAGGVEGWSPEGTNKERGERVRDCLPGGSQGTLWLGKAPPAWHGPAPRRTERRAHNTD